jgi:hypothetical protein
MAQTGASGLRQPGRRVRSALVARSPAVNPASRTREARFGFGKIIPRPGSNGVLRWLDPRALVPADYLTRRAGRLGLFIINGRTARFVPLSDAQEGRPALAAALPENARIVTDGRLIPQDGMAVSQR